MNPLTIAQTVVAVLLMITILLQQRGSGLSGAFGGESNTYATRRGAEKGIFVATIVLVILFIGISIARLII